MKTFSLDLGKVLRVEAVDSVEAGKLMLEKFKELLDEHMVERDADDPRIIAAIAFLEDEIENEMENGGECIGVFRETIAELDAGVFDLTFERLSQFGMAVYEATAGGGMYGDTDYSDSLQNELAEILEITEDDEEDDEYEDEDEDEDV